MVKALLRNKRFSIHGVGTTLQIQVPVFSCEPFTESENDVSYDFDLIKPCADILALALPCRLVRDDT